MNEIAIFQPNQQMVLPAHLQGLGLGVTTDMTAIIGDQRNRIGLKGSRFRQVIAGQEVAVWDENYLDVIIVGVVPTVSRIYYANAYSSNKDDNKPPTCYSVDNIAPPVDLATRQSDTCEKCQWNVKGSKISEDGHEGKACGYFRRMAIILPGDDTGTLYYVDVKSQGLFGESKKSVGKFSMNDYAKMLQMQGVDASILVTRLSFDTDKSVPKLMFQALRYVDENEIAVVQRLGEGAEIAEYLDVNMKTIDISKETSADETGVEEAAAPEPAAAPAVSQPRPVVAQTAPKPAPATTPRPVATPAPKPAAVPQPKPAAVPQPKPVVKPATAQPKPVAKSVIQAKPIAKPAVQIDTGISAGPVEVGSDAELGDLMAELGIDLS